LPKGWPGTSATALFFGLHDKLAKTAMDYARRA
jgi:DNA-binding transcriptional regulator PaaX